MMIAAIIVLFIVVFIILFLHIYAKWFWRSRSSSAMMTTRRLQRLHFIGGQEANHPAAAHNIGLDKSAIDRLPAFIYKAPTAEGETEEGLAFLECSVCLTEFEENDKGRLLPTCKHSFHTDCIDMWLYSHSTCPLCRAVVTPTPLSVITVEQQLQEQQGEELQRGGAEDAPPSTPLFTAHEGISIPSTINHGNAMQYPSNVLFWGNHTQVMASEGSCSTSQRLQERPSSSSSSPTTRAIPQITIEIPGRQDMNLSSPSSNHDQGGSSQPIKSPGLRRMSFKRILSSKVN